MKCQAKNHKTLVTGPLQAASYYVAAQIPAGEKHGFSQENVVLRFLGPAFGNQLSVASLLKKISKRAFFPIIIIGPGNIGDVYRFSRFKKKTDAKHRVETQQKELNARSWQTRIRYQASIQQLPVRT